MEKEKTLTLKATLLRFKPPDDSPNILPKRLCICGDKHRGKIGYYCGACGQKIVDINYYIFI